MQFSTRTVALSLSVAASLTYLLAPAWIPASGLIALKGLSITALAVVALGERRSILAMALLLSSLGDVLLELGRNYFLLGLAAFLTSHVVYTLLFVRHRKSPASPVRDWLVPALVLLYGAAFALWLTPSLGQLRVPVYCYIAAIATTVATASRANYRNRWVLLGALLFLCSDSMLGTVRFKTQFAWSGVWIWTTYYLGQCAIAAGVLRDPDGTAR